MFPGTMTLALAATGVIPPLGVGQIATLVSGAIAVDWSIGVNGVTYPQLYKYLLPYRGMRVPARFAAIVGSALALLAAYGCRRLLAKPHRRVGAHDVDPVAAGGKGLPELGGHDAAAADRRVADDADVHFSSIS